MTPKKKPREEGLERCGRNMGIKTTDEDGGGGKKKERVKDDKEQTKGENKVCNIYSRLSPLLFRGNH